MRMQNILLLLVDRLGRRIPVPPGDLTMGQLFRPEINPGAYRAAHLGCQRPTMVPLSTLWSLDSSTVMPVLSVGDVPIVLNCNSGVTGLPVEGVGPEE
ncbi:hypothetical protein J6590_056107 [Homalodisca vitripennis]|nr:hypothetical protein J6590_056107 [Homalodisca vitripennis]